MLALEAGPLSPAARRRRPVLCLAAPPDLVAVDKLHVGLVDGGHPGDGDLGLPRRRPAAAQQHLLQGAAERRLGGRRQPRRHPRPPLLLLLLRHDDKARRRDRVVPRVAPRRHRVLAVARVVRLERLDLGLGLAVGVVGVGGRDLVDVPRDLEAVGGALPVDAPLDGREARVLVGHRARLRVLVLAAPRAELLVGLHLEG